MFFVGNSLIGWEGRNLPDWVAALGDAQGVAFRMGSDIEPGDLPLSAFLGHEVVVEALASGAYDIWVLQGHELEPVDNPQQFKQAVRDFNRAIVAAGGRTVLFMTWEFPWRRFMPELAEAYESIGRELGLPVIPAGLVFRDCEDSPYSGLGSFFLTANRESPKGSVHENELGSAICAYVTYAILTGRDPSGLPFGLPGSDIQPSMRSYLSRRAWARAFPRLILGDRSGGS